ncbi:MAG: hypothetical protein ORN24_06340 [Burkholderiales bacterium]|nr:hypothetical protein [Burkholderiales bacterium]
MNKLLCLLFVILSLGLSGCEIGSTNRTNNYYGQLISGENAPVNAIFTQLNLIESGNILLSQKANSYFESGVICANEADPTYCQVNESFVNNNESLFGLESNTTVANYVTNNATNAGVGGTKFDRITYTTAPIKFNSAYKGQPNPEVVSGLVVLPTDANGKVLPESMIKGVVIYYHLTLASKSGVPSGFGNKSSTDNQLTFAVQYSLASIYGMSGYIVVAPDYIGQGVDVNNPHPYAVFSSQNALSGIYMLPALNTYLKQAYNFNLNALAHPNLYITSYSEGGGYALKASQLIQTSAQSVVNSVGLNLKRTIGGSGAYDISNTLLGFEFANIANSIESNPWSVSPGCNPAEVGNTLCNDNVTIGGVSVNSPGINQFLAQYQLILPKPALAAYLSDTLVNYFGANIDSIYESSAAIELTNCLNPNTLLASLTESFTYINCNSLFNTTNLNLSNIFSNNGLDNSKIFGVLVYNAMALKPNPYFIGPNSNSTTAVLADISAGNSYNSIANIVSHSFFESDQLISLFKTNGDTYNWTTSSPISILYLKYDSTAPNQSSKIACSESGIKSAGSQNLLNCIEVNNSNLWENAAFGGIFNKAEYLSHGTASSIMHMIGLQQMRLDP